jgi:uncharacterized protein YkwD
MPFKPLSAETIQNYRDKLFIGVNFVRINPPYYAEEVLIPLLAAVKKYWQNPSASPKGSILSKQAVLFAPDGNTSAIESAISQLSKTQPISRVKRKKGLDRASADHSIDISSTQLTGHIGSDKSTPEIRTDRYGKFEKPIIENVVFGVYDPDTLVASLIIDAYDPKRGNRNVLLDKRFGSMGSSIQSHGSRGAVTVMIFAANFTDID